MLLDQWGREISTPTKGRVCGFMPVAPPPEKDSDKLADAISTITIEIQEEVSEL